MLQHVLTPTSSEVLYGFLFSVTSTPFYYLIDFIRAHEFWGVMQSPLKAYGVLRGTTPGPWPNSAHHVDKGVSCSFLVNQCFFPWGLLQVTLMTINYSSPKSYKNKVHKMSFSPLAIAVKMNGLIQI